MTDDVTTPATHHGFLALHAAALLLPPRATSGAYVSALGAVIMIAGARVPWTTAAGAPHTVATTQGVYGKVFVIAGVLTCIAARVRWHGDVLWARMMQAMIGVLSILIAAQLYARASGITHDGGAAMPAHVSGHGLPLVMLGGVLITASLWTGRQR